MPPFCLGVGATAIGDFASAAGDLLVPTELAEACAHAVINSGIDLAVSYNMQVDHGFAQPLEFLLGGSTAYRCCRCLLTASPRRCRVFNAPGCWARRWAAFSIPSISGC